MAEVVDAETVGDCVPFENVFGPDHEYDVNPLVPPVSVKDSPTHTGLLLVAVAVGNAFTVNVIPLPSVHPPAVATYS